MNSITNTETNAKELFINNFPLLFDTLEVNNTLYIFNSDFHLFHKNIMYYNRNERMFLFDEEDRKIFDKYYFNRTNNTWDDNYDKEPQLTHHLTETLLALLELQFEDFIKKYKKEKPNNKIIYINLGDLIFNYNEKKEEELKGTKGMELFNNLFLRKDLFDEKILIIGNHDKNTDLYKKYFDQILSYYEIDKDNTTYIFSHMPIGIFFADYIFTNIWKELKDFFLFCLDNVKGINREIILKNIEKFKPSSKNKIPGSQDINYSFFLLDLSLLKIILSQNKEFVNIHGHLHSYIYNVRKMNKRLNNFWIIMKDIDFENVCIDNFMNKEFYKVI